MLRKDIKALFGAIRKHDNRVVLGLLSREPDLVSSCAKAPPKKDDGQSPLQVAFKTGNFVAADLLLDRGADPNFQEVSSINDWTAPVLHDAIRASVFSEEPDVGLALLRRLIKLGADPNAADSYGNTPLRRALLDARIQNSSGPGFPEAIDDVECRRRLERVFAVLLRAGANPDHCVGQAESPAESVADEPALARLLESRSEEEPYE